MAIRNLRYKGDSLLRKKSREVKKIDSRVITLINDMVETMYKEEGIGLAAPQVGVLKRVAVIDLGDNLIKMINPQIIEKKGEEIDIEGCLSIPGESGKVKRPKKIKVKYLDIDGNEKVLKATGLLARAFCHEIDHLEGVLFIDKTIDD